MPAPTMLPEHVLPFGYAFVYAAFGASGFLLGWVAQRGNYCFVNAMSSVFTTRSYDRFGALLILFGVSALATSVLVVAGVVPAVDQYFDNYFSGWYIVVGAAVFGFGATMAGGCNLSMLYRAASGYVQNWFELVGMMVGTYVFAVAIWPFQSYTMANGILSSSLGAYTEYLPYDLFHSVSKASIGAAAVFLGVPLVAFGLVLQRRTRSKRLLEGALVSAEGFRVTTVALCHAGLEDSLPPVGLKGGTRLLASAKELLLLRKPYGTNLSTLLLAGTLLLVFVSGAGYTFNYLVITSSDGGRFLEYVLMPFGVNLALGTPWYNEALPIVDPSVLMVLMLIVGAFLASYLSGDFKVRVPRKRKRLAIGFSGGILVGVGVRTALGCNVGMMWTSFAQLGYDGLIFLFAMLFGVWVAVKVQRRLI
jgi:uncharacterized protein